MSTRGLTAKNRIRMAERPENPELGDTIAERGQILVYVGRGTWAWFPVQGANLIKLATDHGWGYKVEIKGSQSVVGKDSAGKELTKPVVRIVVYIGRNPGPTKNGKISKGYQYRFMWDTHDVGTFRLVSKYRRTSDEPRWAEVGTMYELKPIITMHPVVRDA